MKIFIDNIEVLELTETQAKVIRNETFELFEDAVKRRLNDVLIEKHKSCMKRLKEKWEPLLAERGVELIPIDSDAFAKIVFAQPDYKSKAYEYAELQIEYAKQALETIKKNIAIAEDENDQSKLAKELRLMLPDLQKQLLINEQAVQNAVETLSAMNRV